MEFSGLLMEEFLDRNTPSPYWPRLGLYLEGRVVHEYLCFQDGYDLHDLNT